MFPHPTNKIIELWRCRCYRHFSNFLRHKSAYLTMMRGTFARFARACFVVCTFRIRSRYQRHEVTCSAVVQKKCEFFCFFHAAHN